MLDWTVLEGGFKQVQVGLDVAGRRIQDSPEFLCARLIEPSPIP